MTVVPRSSCDEDGWHHHPHVSGAGTPRGSDGITDKCIGTQWARQGRPSSENQDLQCRDMLAGVLGYLGLVVKMGSFVVRYDGVTGRRVSADEGTRHAFMGEGEEWGGSWKAFPIRCPQAVTHAQQGRSSLLATYLTYSACFLAPKARDLGSKT